MHLPLTDVRVLFACTREAWLWHNSCRTSPRHSDEHHLWELFSQPDSVTLLSTSSLWHFPILLSSRLSSGRHDNLHPCLHCTCSEVVTHQKCLPKNQICPYQNSRGSTNTAWLVSITNCHLRHIKPFPKWNFCYHQMLCQGDRRAKPVVSRWFTPGMSSW